MQRQRRFSGNWRAHLINRRTTGRFEDLAIDARGSQFRIRDLAIVCPLAGEHQVENARTAAIALHQLGFSTEGIAHTRWPGRLERVSNEPEIILDGAHNPAGAQALAHYIRRFYAGRNLWLVYGVMRDKAVEEMTALLFPLASRVILTVPANSRAMPPERIPNRDARITHSVREALELVRSGRPHRRHLYNRLLVCCRGGPRSYSYNKARNVILARDPDYGSDRRSGDRAVWSLRIFISFFDSSGGDRQIAVARAWGRAICRIMGVRLETEGLEKISPALIISSLRITSVTAIRRFC